MQIDPLPAPPEISRRSFEVAVPRRLLGPDPVGDAAAMRRARAEVEAAMIAPFAAYLRGLK